MMDKDTEIMHGHEILGAAQDAAGIIRSGMIDFVRENPEAAVDRIVALEAALAKADVEITCECAFLEKVTGKRHRPILEPGRPLSSTPTCEHGKTTKHCTISEGYNGPYTEEHCPGPVDEAREDPPEDEPAFVARIGRLIRNGLTGSTYGAVAQDVIDEVRAHLSEQRP